MEAELPASETPVPLNHSRSYAVPSPILRTLPGKKHERKNSRVSFTNADTPDSEGKRRDSIAIDRVQSPTLATDDEWITPPIPLPDFETPSKTREDPENNANKLTKMSDIPAPILDVLEILPVVRTPAKRKREACTPTHGQYSAPGTKFEWTKAGIPPSEFQTPLSKKPRVPTTDPVNKPEMLPCLNSAFSDLMQSPDCLTGRGLRRRPDPASVALIGPPMTPGAAFLKKQLTPGSNSPRFLQSASPLGVLSNNKNNNSKSPQYLSPSPPLPSTMRQADIKNQELGASPTPQRAPSPQRIKTALIMLKDFRKLANSVFSEFESLSIFHTQWENLSNLKKEVRLFVKIRNDTYFVYDVDEVTVIEVDLEGLTKVIDGFTNRLDRIRWLCRNFAN